MARTKQLDEHPKVAAYVRGVLGGEIVVGRYARLAVERYERDKREADARGIWLDAEEGHFAIDFIECLRHSKGEWAGEPLELEPWQAFIVWNLFAWKREDHQGRYKRAGGGVRRFNTAFVKVARKNGKSTLGAAIGHKLFVADNEAGAEVYTAATKLKQAKIVHDEAKRMVKRSPGLKNLITVLRDNLSIDATNSKYEPLASDSETHDGLNVSGAIVDEVHAHPDRGLWDVIETATGARRQPLMLAITTAGTSVNAESIYYELREYSIKVLEGLVRDDTWFAVLYELDAAEYDTDGQQTSPGDDWTDEATWPKANPNLGVSVKLDDLRRKAKKAKETPAAAQNFRVKHLDEEVEGVNAWLPMGLWDANAGDVDWYAPEGLRPEAIERWRGRAAWAAADLASVSDLTALVLAIPDDDGSIDLVSFCWCPRDNAIGRQRDKRVPYVTWAELGLMELTEGDSVDYDRIRAVLRMIRDEWGIDVREVGCDPFNARYVLTRLEEEDEFLVHEHKQGFLSMNTPIKATEKLLLDRKIRHGGHRPTGWCVSNVVVVLDAAGNKKFAKDKAREKIDLAVAAVMAVGRAVESPDDDDGASVFYPGEAA